MFIRYAHKKVNPTVFRRFYSKNLSAPQSVLFVKKRNDDLVSAAMVSIAKYLRCTYPSVRLLHEETSLHHHENPAIDTGRENGTEPWSLKSKDAVDLVITLGGDGTILHASSLFKTGPVPPVLSFSMGTLGFLLPFHIDDFRVAIRDVFDGRATVLERMRLACTFSDTDGQELDVPNLAGWQVMNEVTLHRGRSPHLSIVDVYVDGVHLTEAFSDGLIISTPTGSTAYSLSAGGPIVHPSVKALLLTPISPRSLSFRPLLLPGTSQLMLKINMKSRAPVEVSMDGQLPPTGLDTLCQGQSVRIQMSQYPIPCVKRSSVLPEAEGDGTSDNRSDDWVGDINTLLQFNATFRNKGMLRHTH
ncbi:ATP-NAD kinase-like domain-containing protein [Hysterangium stoloniferum]|nr:ATP-NAD kinase-like domain-containing protein [Hysterangium stoloniferum]